jgi:signal peptidase I
VQEAAPTAEAPRPVTVADLIEASDAAAAPIVEDEAPTGARRAAEWLAVVFGAVVVAILIKAFLFQAFFIPSESMESTLEPGDRVLVNKVSYDLHDVHRGDVVVFSLPGFLAPGEPQGDLIKRVIGLPGDTVEVRPSGVYINGALLQEPYVDAASGEGPTYPRTRVPEHTVFVMGDNRSNSRDSRFFGPVPNDAIVGRAFFRLWPLSSIGSL